MKKLLSLVAIAAIMASCTDAKKEETVVTVTDSISMDATNASAMADTANKMMDKAADKMEQATDKMEKASDKMEHATDKMMEKKP